MIQTLKYLQKFPSDDVYILMYIILHAEWMRGTRQPTHSEGCHVTVIHDVYLVMKFTFIYII